MRRPNAWPYAQLGRLLGMGSSQSRQLCGTQFEDLRGLLQTEPVDPGPTEVCGAQEVAKHV